MKCLVAAVAALLVAAAIPSAQSVSPAVFGDLRWRSIGPPRSGYVSAPAGVPGDPTTYYVGLPEGGVWKTTNAGTTWKPVFDDVRVASVGAVAVAPSNPDVVYVGTGNQSGWSFTPGQGVYKSADAGHTWTQVGLGHSLYIGGIVVDPKSPDRVLVAAGPRPAGRGGAGAATDADVEKGIYRTTDGGKSWNRVLAADGPAGASDVYGDYADPTIAFALIVGGEGIGIHKSIDGGATWQPLSGQGMADGARVLAFAVSAGTHGQRLYAVAAAAGRGAGGRAGRTLYRSDDGGARWIAATSQLASADGKMYADPQHPDVMYLMGTAIYRSTNGGPNLAAFWGAPSGADPRFLWIDPTNSKRMLAGVDQGPAITVDGGNSWTPYYGLVNGQFYRVATDYDVPYHVCGPQQDSGTACVLSRSDFGEIRPTDWYTPGGFENGFLIADPLDRRYMYTQGWYHVLRRFDRQTNQVTVLYQPSADERFGGAPPLAFSPGDAKTLYMGAQHLLASDDRGTTWRRISPDLAAPAGSAAPPAGAAVAVGAGAPAPGGSIQSLAISTRDASVIWVGASTGLIHVTRNAGKTWTNVTPKDLPPAGINVLEASHAAAGTAYAALLSRDAKPHLYRTTDYGQTWQETVAGITDAGTARVVREDPSDPSILYAGTVMGVWVSFDRGDHWQPLQLNLPATVVSDLTVHGSDVVISTYGRGFWILDNVGPLRQSRTALAANGAYLFKPETTSRARWDNTQDTPMPPEMVVGPNPPEGAVIDYYLPEAASGPLTLTVKDSTGATIRQYTNTAPPADTTMANVPEYWLMPPPVLPATAGMHRVSWDLRYPDPPTLNYGYTGTLLDYREYTLSWHAIPGRTPRSTLVGPMVLPDSYTVTLAVNGRTLSQPLTVVQDPRVTVSAAALEAQFRLQQRMVAGITTTFAAVSYLDRLRLALTTGLGGGSGGATEALRGVETSLAPMIANGNALGLAHRDLARRLNDQLVADFEPTPSVVAGVDAPCAAITAALEQLRTVQARVAQVNSGLPAGQALPVWTPPASACGR